MRHRLQPQLLVQQGRRIYEAVAMDAAEPREAGVLQARHHAEDARLLGVAQLGLEADDVVERAERIVPAELHDGMGASARARVGQATGFIGPKRSVSSPRAAITSTGRQPSNQGVSASHSLNSIRSASSSASTKAS